MGNFFEGFVSFFLSTDFSTYQVRKSMGREFTQKVYDIHGKETFKILIENPPITKELKEPQLYLKRISQ